MKARQEITVRDQWECLDLCTETDDQPTENLQSGLAGRQTIVIWMRTSAADHPVRKRQREGRLQAAERHLRFKCSGPRKTTLLSAGGQHGDYTTIQEVSGVLEISNTDDHRADKRRPPVGPDSQERTGQG